jgi:hypothetical protein
MATEAFHGVPQEVWRCDCGANHLPTYSFTCRMNMVLPEPGKGKPDGQST